MSNKSVFLPGRSIRQTLLAVLVLSLLLMISNHGQTDTNRLYRGIPAISSSAKAAVCPANTAGEQEMAELVKNDHITLLQACLDSYERNICDYTGTFYKRERVNGKFGKEPVISFKFKETPFSLAMQWCENPGPADKMLYVEGKNENKMLVHPTGLLAWIKSMKVDPENPDAMKSTLYPCTQFGFYRNMKNAVDDYRIAKQQGDLEMKYIGECLVDTRPCWQIERILADRPQYPITRLVIKIDKQYKVPVFYKGFDACNELQFTYAFTNLAFNVGLTDADFTPQANGL